MFSESDGIITLELVFWSLVGNLSSGKLAIYIDQSLWQSARAGADMPELRQRMADAINAKRAQIPGLMAMDEQGLRMLVEPAEDLVNEWRAEWCLDYEN